MNMAIYYYRHTVKLFTSENFIAYMPKNITTEDGIFFSIAEVLKIPETLRTNLNWNSLRDLINDFHWIKEKNIYLIHEEYPKISQKSKEIYIEILSEANSLWKENQEHEFAAFFKTGEDNF
jgi:hypothetical protein